MLERQKTSPGKSGFVVPISVTSGFRSKNSTSKTIEMSSSYLTWTWYIYHFRQPKKTLQKGLYPLWLCSGLCYHMVYIIHKHLGAYHYALGSVSLVDSCLKIVQPNNRDCIILPNMDMVTFQTKLFIRGCTRCGFPWTSHHCPLFAHT